MSEQTTMGVGELDRERSQFFTPADLALKVWRWAVFQQGRPRMHVLEPSAGRGALIEPMIANGWPWGGVVACEIDPVNVAALWAGRAFNTFAPSRCCMGL